MSEVFRCVSDDAGHCITCSDEATPMTVIVIDEDQELAVCEAVDASRHTVEIALVAPVHPGERLLIHAGTAIQRLEQAVS